MSNRDPIAVIRVLFALDVAATVGTARAFVCTFALACSGQLLAATAAAHSAGFSYCNKQGTRTCALRAHVAFPLYNGRNTNTNTLFPPLNSINFRQSLPTKKTIPGLLYYHTPSDHLKTGA